MTTMKSQILFLWVIALFQAPANSAAIQDSVVDKPQNYTISSRENRFPSVEERVKLYMSNWYVPPCPGYDNGLIRYRFEKPSGSEWNTVKVSGYPHHPLVNSSVIFELNNIITPDMIFLMDEEIISNCANPDFDEATEKDSRQLKLAARVKFRANMRMYCHDVRESLLEAWNHVQWENEGSSIPPALLQFGDNKYSHVYGGITVPLIKKFRSATLSPKDLELVTSQQCYSNDRDVLATFHHTDQFQPIVWKLATHRHYDKLYQVYQKDTAWNNKKNLAIFRGQLTGSRDGYNKTLTDKENCQRLIRCRLVYNHHKSKYIDAKLTSTRNRLPDILSGVPLLSKKIDLQDMMEYKGLIMIEGNDVASGLKWALLSQSVVLMPPPKHTSWAMEELLEPWVHYIPLDEAASDVEEKMKWIIDNDEAAQRISERATLWMEDLIFHPNAAEDDRLIEEEILRRYRAHFETL